MHRDKCYRMSEVYRELLEEGVSFTLSKIDLKKNRFRESLACRGWLKPLEWLTSPRMTVSCIRSKRRRCVKSKPQEWLEEEESPSTKKEESLKESQKRAVFQKPREENV